MARRPPAAHAARRVIAAWLLVASLHASLTAAAAGATQPVPGRTLMEADGTFGARRGWVRGRPTPPAQEIDLLFALTHRNVRQLEAELLAVSTPSSSRYRQHLTFEQVNALTAPPTHAIKLVTTLAKRHSATQVKVLPAGDYVSVVLPAARAAEMLRCAPFHSYSHPESRQTLHRTHTVYSLPDEVAAVVDFVGGVSRLPATGFRNHRNAAHRLASVHKSHPRAGVDAPQILNVLGGGSQQVFVAPRCSDGTPATVAAPCGVTGGTAVFTPDGGLGHSVTSANTKCGPCNDFHGGEQFPQPFAACSALDKKNNVAGLYCSTSVANVLLGVNTTVAATTEYADGSTSATSTSSTITQPYATPSFLKNLYGVPSGIVAQDGGNTQAVVEFLGQYYNPADLKAYMTRFGLPVPAAIPVNGPNNAASPGLEASLDVEVITSIAEQVPTSFWSTAGLRNNSAPASNTNQEPFLAWVTRLLSTPDAEVPTVNSVSYDDDEDSMPHAFSDNLNVQFMKAGTRGLSLLFCAGDDGVGGETVRAHGAAACPVFKPAFPAASPYVLSIGATQMLRVNGGPLSEVASDTVTGSIVTGGGGFSNRYPAPMYQSAFVQDFLKESAAVLPPASYFNRSGRAYPDVSGIGTNYLIVINNTWWQIGGTSASTPLVAAMVSLMNDKAMAAGRGPLGFLNPLIYSLGKAPFVNDITYGNNRCSAVPTNCCPYGFFAAKGFDPVTGLGSPDFQALYEIA